MSTDARQTARQYYAAHGRDMGSDIAALLANPQGVVLLSPRLVALLKPVCTRSPEQWTNLEQSPCGADGWYVHLLCGDLALARRLACTLPPLRLLVFQRGGRGERWHSCRWQRVLSPTRY